MLTSDTLLLCHHGTEGASRAEALAYRIAEPGRTTIVHCLVVPELWAGMQGDDWLNNATTRDTFAQYVEGLLERDAAGEFEAVSARCAERGIAYKAVSRFGDPAECAAAIAAEEGVDLVVVGPSRPKGMLGLRSRMDLERLTSKLDCTLLIASRQ
ncbi:MAG: hypothetical protein D4R84_12325 [Rhodocyclaceae bacterium]|nr:MAG: hypothetical protein D4R84_12325 [Rhodocyclaceae bacterium]